MTRQRQHRRFVAQLHDVTVGLDHLVGVAGPQSNETGHGAEGRKLFDRLVGGTILAVAHGIVGEHEDRRQLHQRRQPDRRPRVITEDEERGAEGPQFRQ